MCVCVRAGCVQKKGLMFMNKCSNAGPTKKLNLVEGIRSALDIALEDDPTARMAF